MATRPTHYHHPKPQQIGMTGGSGGVETLDGIVVDETILRWIIIGIFSIVGMYVMRTLVQRITYCIRTSERGSRREGGVTSEVSTVGETTPTTTTTSVLVDEARPSSMTNATITSGPDGVPITILDKIAAMKLYDKAGEDTEEICAICLDNIETEQRIRMLPCNHTFHDHCAVRWLCRANRCPVCNAAPMKPESVAEKPHEIIDIENTEEEEEELTRLLAQALGENRLLRARLARARAAVSRRWRRIRRRRTPTDATTTNNDNNDDGDVSTTIDAVAPTPEVTNPSITNLASTNSTQSLSVIAV